MSEPDERPGTTLEAADLTSRQAEAVTKTIRELRSLGFALGDHGAIAEGAATKEGIDCLEARIASTEARLIKWMVGVGIASVGLAAAVGLLLRLLPG